MKNKAVKEKNAVKNNVNEGIRARRVVLIDSSGENRGEVDTRDALNEAKEQNLDLVEMSSSPQQTVCKIMDYGKYLFDANKRKKQNSKDSRGKNEIKEIRLRPAIDQHDLETKANQAKKFLEAGKKVKLDVRMKGRERRHPELATEVIERFVEVVGEIAKLDKNGINYMLVPK